MKNGFFGFIGLLSIGTTQAQNVGIGTTNPQAQLHTIGTVRHEALALPNATGTRPVYVNQNGNLITPGNTYSNSTPVTIPPNDCTGISSSITISDLSTAVKSSQIHVKLNISFTKAYSLFIYLISPANEVLNLAYANGTSAPNYTNTVFSDGATQFLSAGVPPFTGSFNPTGSTALVGQGPNHSPGSNIQTLCTYTGTLTNFAGFGGGTIVPNGTWTLKVINGYQLNGGTGTLDSWSIRFDNTEGFDGTPLAANYVAKAVADASGFTNSSIYDNGNVGIGTTTPAQKLDVAGTVNATKVTTSSITGTSANMTAVAYGKIHNNSLISSSGNVTMTRLSAGQYALTFTGSLSTVNFQGLTVVLTLKSPGYGINTSYGYDDTVIGKITVIVYNNDNFTYIDGDVSFAIFKPS